MSFLQVRTALNSRWRTCFHFSLLFLGCQHGACHVWVTSGHRGLFKKWIQERKGFRKSEWAAGEIYQDRHLVKELIYGLWQFLLTCKLLCLHNMSKNVLEKLLPEIQEVVKWWVCLPKTPYFLLYCLYFPHCFAFKRKEHICVYCSFLYIIVILYKSYLYFVLWKKKKQNSFKDFVNLLIIVNCVT